MKIKKKKTKKDNDRFLGAETAVIFPKEETSKNKKTKTNIRKAIDKLFKKK